MSRILICEDNQALVERSVAAFVAVGYSGRDVEGAVKALADAFATPPTIELSAHDFSGLEGRILLRDRYCFGEENHPDGWYRKFYDANPPTSPRAAPRGNQGGRGSCKHRWR